MSDKKPEKTKAPMGTKKKVILAFVILGLLGSGYYGNLWLNAQKERSALWNEKTAQERF